MKNAYIKLNDLWMAYRRWSESGIVGDFVFGTIRILFIFAIFFLIFTGLFIVGPFSDIGSAPQDSSSDTSNTNSSGNVVDENCSVTGIVLRGALLTYIPNHSDNDSSFNHDVVSSENVTWLIQKANDDPKIKAILVTVDSGGGSPVAGEEISDAIKNSVKPVVALIRQSGASASYWAISSANKIFASKNSDVGSIGVINSYLNSVEKNKKEGYTYEQLTIGKYKDSGSPNKTLTSEEKTLFLRDMNIVYNNFIGAVSQNRKIPIEKVRGFADGSTFLGETAKSLGLIDEIGGTNEVDKYLEETIGEKPDICW